MTAADPQNAADVARALRQARSLAELTRSLVSTLDLDESVDRLMRMVVPSVADWCVINLLDDAGRIERVAGHHRDPAFDEVIRRFVRLEPEVMDVDSAVWRVLRRGQPLLLPHVEAGRVREHSTGDELAAITDSMGFASAIVVPLESRRRTVGSLSLLRGPDRERYGDEDLLLATDIGRRAGLAFDNARLYGEQRHGIEVLQRSLLTELPHVPGVRLDACYVPAAQQAQVGGDWYDAFVGETGRLWLVIGDVMGHDVNAAAAMGQLRSFVRASAFASTGEPSAVAAATDRAIVGLRLGTLATSVLACIDDLAGAADGTRTLRWSCAGHPPPLLLHADGTVETLAEQGDLLLGLDPSAPRRTRTAAMPPGSTLVLFTDGLVERRGEPIETGLVRVRQALASLAGAPLDGLCDALVDRVLPGAPEDDVAVLVARVG